MKNGDREIENTLRQFNQLLMDIVQGEKKQIKKHVDNN